ncbi:hypothetical protein FGB62_25g019 [Gracilaria domingensis]|nr:hypothetical protein FGB62_25g019 [Gracilaria domingensis]
MLVGSVTAGHSDADAVASRATVRKVAKKERAMLKLCCVEDEEKLNSRSSDATQRGFGGVWCWCPSKSSSGEEGAVEGEQVNECCGRKAVGKELGGRRSSRESREHAGGEAGLSSARRQAGEAIVSWCGRVLNNALATRAKKQKR